MDLRQTLLFTSNTSEGLYEDLLSGKLNGVSDLAIGSAEMTNFVSSKTL